MLMDNDTIVTLYREAVDNGDPKEIINSMAKTNGCSPVEIRQILSDAGEFVPRQKRGRPKAAAAEEERARAEETADIVINLIEREKKRAANMSAPPNVKCADIPEEVWEDLAAGNERRLPLPDAVKECIMIGLDSIEAQIKKKTEELALLEAKHQTITEYMKT